MIQKQILICLLKRDCITILILRWDRKGLSLKNVINVNFNITLTGIDNFADL